MEVALDAVMEKCKGFFLTCNAMNSETEESRKSKVNLTGEIQAATTALDEKLKVANLSPLAEAFRTAIVGFISSGNSPKEAREAAMGESFEKVVDLANSIASDPAVVKERQQALEARIPVLVITGFLGSGKTTLLNYILTEKHGFRIAVIENEYGEIGIDDALVKGNKFSDTEEIFEMNNGCICCTVRGDLIRTLTKLMERKDKFDYVIIETTGLADPAPVAQTFFIDKSISGSFRLDAIVTVADAKHLIMHLDEKKPDGVENESVEQISFADKILLNKLDLVPDAAEVEHIKKRIRALNPGAAILPCQSSRVPLNEILNLRSFDLNRILDIDPAFLKEEDEHCDDSDCDHEDHKHENKEKKEKHEKHEQNKEKKEGHKKKHQHDKTTSSVGIHHEGEFDLDKLNDWMGMFLKTNGPSIYRMKGILAIKGMPRKFVFQGVHMLFDGEPTQPWAEGEKRESKVVFIGKKLNRAEIRAGLLSCVA